MGDQLGLGGVGGGAACSGAHSLEGTSGLRRSYPVRLSLAVQEFESMTICCVDKNGIPRIRGTGSPVLTLAQNIVDFQLLFPDDNSNLTYSLQDIGDLDNDERLSSSCGKGYRCRPSSLAQAELITTEGCSAGIDNGNSEILGPKVSNEAMRCGTVRGGSTYESVSSSQAPWCAEITAAAGRCEDKAPELGLAAKAISRVRGIYVLALGQVLLVVISQLLA